MSRFRETPVAQLVLSERLYIYSSHLCAVLGVRLNIKGHLLTFLECLVTLALDNREMNEDIVSALVVGNKSVSLFSVKPFYSTVIHYGYLRYKICTHIKTAPHTAIKKKGLIA